MTAQKCPSNGLEMASPARAISFGWDLMRTAFAAGGRAPGDAQRRFAPDLRAVQTALGGITPRDLRALAAFAGRLLDRVGLPGHLGEDLAQRAILAVLVGGRSKLRGRHPRPADLTSPMALLNYFRGVICSLVHGQRSRSENRFIHTAFEEATARCPAAGRDLEFEDLAQTFYEHLRARVPPRLRSVLEDWREERFAYIPLGDQHRRRRSELRRIAAEVLRELQSRTG